MNGMNWNFSIKRAIRILCNIYTLFELKTFAKPACVLIGYKGNENSFGAFQLYYEKFCKVILSSILYRFILLV